MKLKKYLVFLLISTTSFYGISQENKTKKTVKQSEFWRRVNFGGNLTFNISNGVTSLGASPSAVYQVNNKFSTGAGINFGYTSYRDINAKQFNYGLSLINLYTPIQGLQLSGELAHTFVNESIKENGETFKRDFSFPAIYIGAGYSVGHFTAGLRYDILYNENKSIYSSPLTPFARVYF